MKRVKLLLIIFIAMLVCTCKVNAMNVSRTSLTEGETFTASVSFAAASWNVHISANGPVSGCSIDEVNDSGDLSTINKTVSVSCTSTGPGTITVKVTGDYAILVNDEILSTNISDTKTVTVNAKQVYQPPVYTYTPPTYYTKSANNNLSSIGVEGATISTEFDPGTTEYEVTMPAGTTEINVIATKDDYRATVTGDGKREVTDGPNSIEVIVTSESGISKTYTLIVTVEEEAIPVRFNGDDYSFIRKSNNLPKVSSYYSVTSTIYNGIEVPAYYSEVTKLTLVGLKDNKGKSNLYVYNPDKHSFNLYSEINLGNIAVYIKTPSKGEIISELKETIVKIDEKEYSAYQFDLESEYYLIYGTNANTNNTGWFIYDSGENTLQRYNMDEVINLTKQRDKLILIIKLLGTLCIISIVFMIIIHKTVERKEINKN